jgi:hypothetical protein
VWFAFRRIIGIAKVQENHSVVGQDPPHLAEAVNDRLDVSVDCRLVSDLTFNPVISLPVIRRTRDDAMDTSGREFLKRESTITLVKLPPVSVWGHAAINRD